MIEDREILGHYFPYCQWCTHDESCVLLHCEYMGVESSDEVDSSPYPGHEDIGWGITGFQGGRSRSACSGRIVVTDSPFYPLACPCGTVVSSLTFSGILGVGFCCKFNPNAQAEKRLRMAVRLLAHRGTTFEQGGVLNERELGMLDHNYPEDPDYPAAMRH